MATSAISATCAFCDANLVEHTVAIEPADRITPFDVPRDRAVRLLKGFLQEHWLAPEGVRQAADPSELRAVFVPFYAYDAVARTEYRCSVGVDWKRTETYTTTENGRQVTRTRVVNETEWFSFQGTHGRTWFGHLVSASRGLPESEANQLEPYDLGRSHPYAPAHHAGMEAEHATIPHDEANKTAHHELSELEKWTIERQFLPGDKVRMLETTSNFDIQAVSLHLLPVWVAAVEGPEFGQMRMLVNGQTGEVVADIPRSTVKIVALIVAGSALVFLLIATILCLNGGEGVLM